MAENKFSIKDIAEECGTSITTVSFVINGRAAEKRISKATTSKIQATIERLGFIPDSFAQGLRTGRSKMIGFLIDDITAPFYSGIAKYVDEKAAVFGYKIIFCCTGNDLEKTSGLIKMLVDRNIDGCIVALPDAHLVSQISNSKVPLVLFDHYIPGLKIDQVIVDNYESVYDATVHLIDNGYSKITYINPVTSQHQMIDRCRGYLEAMKHYSLPNRVVDLAFPADGHTQGLVEELLTNDPPEALIFGAHYVTMHVVKVMMGLDKGLFGRIGMVSFDDLEIFDYFPVSMTAIEQPLEKIASRIVEVMLAKLADKSKSEPLTRVVATRLNVRESSKKYR